MNDLTYPADAMRAANVEAERLRDEVTLLRKQRRALWMLLEHIDTDRNPDAAFRTFARKQREHRFEIWNPESDGEALSAQRRVAALVDKTFDCLGDGTAIENTEIAEAYKVPANVMHPFIEHVFACQRGHDGDAIGKCLFALYLTADTHGIDADAELEKELAETQQPDVMAHILRRHRTIRAGVVDLDALAGIEFDEENALALGAVDTESVRENRRLTDIVSKKRAGDKHVSFDTDLLTKYDLLVKYWPANTLDIFVKRLTDIPTQHIITNRPRSATALFAALEIIHGDREEAEYEIKIVDNNTRKFRGQGRIVMPDTRSSTEQ